MARPAKNTSEDMHFGSPAVYKKDPRLCAPGSRRVCLFGASALQSHYNALLLYAEKPPLSIKKCIFYKSSTKFAVPRYYCFMLFTTPPDKEPIRKFLMGMSLRGGITAEAVSWRFEGDCFAPSGLAMTPHKYFSDRYKAGGDKNNHAFMTLPTGEEGKSW